MCYVLVNNLTLVTKPFLPLFFVLCWIFIPIAILPRLLSCIFAFNWVFCVFLLWCFNPQNLWILTSVPGDNNETCILLTHLMYMVIAPWQLITLHFTEKIYQNISTRTNSWPFCYSTEGWRCRTDMKSFISPLSSGFVLSSFTVSHTQKRNQPLKTWCNRMIPKFAQ